MIDLATNSIPLQEKVPGASHIYDGAIIRKDRCIIALGTFNGIHVVEVVSRESNTGVSQEQKTEKKEEHPLTIKSLLAAPMLRSQFMNKIAYLPSCHSLITTSWSEIDLRDNLLNVYVIQLKSDAETTDEKNEKATFIEATSIESIVITKDMENN